MLKIKIYSYFIFRKMIKGLLLVFGFWPKENPSLMYRLISYGQLPLNFGMSVAIFNFVRLHVTNISFLTKSFGVMTTYVSSTLKLTCFLIYQKEALQLHHDLDTSFNKLARDAKMKGIIFKKFTLLISIIWVFFICVFITLLPMIITPLIEIVMKYKKYEEDIKLPMIYPSKYPWQTSHGIPYTLSFIFEALATLSLFCITMRVDTLFLFYIFQMIAQLRELSYSITNANTFDDDKKSEVLSKAINQYQMLIKHKETIEKIYGPIILLIMCTNAVIMCVFIFQFKEINNLPIIRLTIIFAYIWTKILQTFIYAWSGTCLTAESEDFRDAVYNIEWFGNKKIMNSVIILLSQRTMIVSACGFAPVTVDIFIMTLKTTGSYYFLLQTLEEK